MAEGKTTRTGIHPPSSTAHSTITSSYTQTTEDFVLNVTGYELLQISGKSGKGKAGPKMQMTVPAPGSPRGDRAQAYPEDG